MRLRLFGLLLVAGACTWLAAAVATASAEKTSLAGPPSTRPVQGGANPCPVPRRFRPAFERAAGDTGLPLALLVSVARVESNLRARARSHARALDAGD